MDGKRLDNAIRAATSIMDHLTDWEWNDPRNIFDESWYVEMINTYIDTFVGCFDAKESKKVSKVLRDDFNHLEASASRRDFGEVATDTALIGQHLLLAIRHSTSLWVKNDVMTNEAHGYIGMRGTHQDILNILSKLPQNMKVFWTGADGEGVVSSLRSILQDPVLLLSDYGPPDGLDMYITDVVEDKIYLSDSSRIKKETRKYKHG